MPRKPPTTPPPPAKPRRAPPFVIFAVVVVVVVVAAYLGVHVMNHNFKPKPQNQVLQAVLAGQFHGDADSMVPNIPSRDGRYPGAVLAVSPRGSELLVRAIDRPETVPQVVGSLTAVQVTGADAALQFTGTLFGSQQQGAGIANVEVDLQDIRIYEEEAGKIAQSLRDDEEVSRARQSGLHIVVVTRAYEAAPRVTIRQRSDAKAEDWAKYKEAAVKANGTISNDDSVVFSSTTPQVVAYETNDANFIATSLGAGDLKVELKPRVAPPGSPGTPRASDFGAQSIGGSVRYATIASSRYTAENFYDLPVAEPSADLVGQLFDAAGATRLETGLDAGARLTTEQFNAAVDRLVASLKANQPHAFVLYYAGHAVSGMAGASYLVLGDYKGKIADDLKQTSPFVPPAANPDMPLAGSSNLNDLLKAVSVAGQELAPSQSGLISLAELHAKLAEAGVPFAIVADGCYAADALDQLRQQLRFTQWGDYYGADDAAADKMEEYQAALRSYGNAPYLRSSNPVVFAARPGTLATPVSNPFFGADTLSSVAPLAAKLGSAYMDSLLKQENLSLGQWLRSTADFAGTGEQDFKGSISWSDFDALKKIPMFGFPDNQPTQ